MQALLDKLAKEGGCIVSTADCSELEVAEAKTRGDFYVDDNQCGYVRRLPEWINKHSRFARGAEPSCCELDVITPADQWAKVEGSEVARRVSLGHMTREEIHIQSLIDSVEELGAHPKLTDVVIKLGEAQHRLADWVEMEDK